MSAYQAANQRELTMINHWALNQLPDFIDLRSAKLKYDFRFANNWAELKCPTKNYPMFINLDKLLGLQKSYWSTAPADRPTAIYLIWAYDERLQLINLTNLIRHHQAINHYQLEKKWRLKVQVQPELGGHWQWELIFDPATITICQNPSQVLAALGHPALALSQHWPPTQVGVP